MACSVARAKFTVRAGQPEGQNKMRISARNILKGTIVDVVKGQTTAHVTIDVGGAIVTASITNESVEDLGLKMGMAAAAVIKSSDVMVAVD
jgi:molybdopterin-binding protein